MYQVNQAIAPPMAERKVRTFSSDLSEQG